MCNNTLTDLIVDALSFAGKRYLLCLLLICLPLPALARDPIERTPPGDYFAVDEHGNLFRFSFPYTGGYPPAEGQGPTVTSPDELRKELGADQYDEIVGKAKPKKLSFMQRIMKANEAARIRHQPTVNVNYTIKQLP